MLCERIANQRETLNRREAPLRSAVRGNTRRLVLRAQHRWPHDALGRKFPLAPLTAGALEKFRPRAFSQRRI